MATEADAGTGAARISRRNALKAGAALGVGAAALAGPQIGMLGTTPAYAAACSQPWVEAGSDCINTSCNCGGPGTLSEIEYKALTLTGSGASATVSPGCGGATTVSITAPSSAGQCRVRVDAYQGNNQCLNQDQSAFIDGASTVGVAGGTTASVTLPAILCAGGANIFTRLTLECNGDTDTTCT